jgi:hypothetical protein
LTVGLSFVEALSRAEASVTRELQRLERECTRERRECPRMAPSRSRPPRATSPDEPFFDDSRSGRFELRPERL